LKSPSSECDGWARSCDGVSVADYTVRKATGRGARAVSLCAACVAAARASGFEVKETPILDRHAMA
jgi:hypothetical protein